MTQFGKTGVEEQLYRHKNKVYRPFMTSAEVCPRGYSRRVERIITDFGSDCPFAQVLNKLKEHYGIEGVSVSAVRQITEYHAEQMLKRQTEQDERNGEKLYSKTKGCETVIGEIDGCMLPTIEVDADSKDKRKGKKASWKEARLSLAYKQGSVNPRFRAVFESSVDEAGESLRHCAISVGLGKQTRLHAVGDGAPWIAEQVEDKFGSQATYLIDFYHVCQYLAEAAKVCAPDESKAWMETQKQRLKNNQAQMVLCALNNVLQSDKIRGDKTAVQKCYDYLSKRPNYLDYKGALEKSLPIGSGQIESAHRYVIQKRLKLPGTWWKVENIKRMLALRVLRANGEWNAYWDDLSTAA